MGTDKQRAVDRGSPKAKGSAPSRGLARINGKSGHVAPSWVDAAGALLAIDSVIETGDAIIIGRTRDGGAIAVTLISGDEREKLYASDDEELSDLIQTVLRAYREAEPA